MDMDVFLPRDKDEFSVALRTRLAALNMTQRDLASRLATRPETVNAWAQGRTMPTSKRLIRGVQNELGIAVPNDPKQAELARVEMDARVEDLERTILRMQKELNALRVELAASEARAQPGPVVSPDEHAALQEKRRDPRRRSGR